MSIVQRRIYLSVYSSTHFTIRAKIQIFIFIPLTFYVFGVLLLLQHCQFQCIVHIGRIAFFECSKNEDPQQQQQSASQPLIVNY